MAGIRLYNGQFLKISRYALLQTRIVYAEPVGQQAVINAAEIVLKGDIIIHGHICRYGRGIPEHSGNGVFSKNEHGRSAAMVRSTARIRFYPSSEFGKGHAENLVFDT